MTDLLFSSDQKEIDKIVTLQQKSAFRHACSYKNNQMQEFDKWKHKNKWKINVDNNYYWRYKGSGVEVKSFSELFEIFIKETSR